jgi:hypothetical protein
VAVAKRFAAEGAFVFMAGILLTHLPAFFAAGVACVVAALLVLTIGKRSTAATVAR